MNYIGCEGNESSIEDCNHRKFAWIDKGNTANVTSNISEEDFLGPCHVRKEFAA